MVLLQMMDQISNIFVSKMPIDYFSKLLLFDLYRYAVDGYWKHDPEVPALKNEHGHFNNMIKIKDSTEVFTIKNPNADKKLVKDGRTRCLSGDETLVLSGVDDVLSLNDTLLLSGDANTFDDGNISDDDLLQQAMTHYFLQPPPSPPVERPSNKNKLNCRKRLLI